MSFNEEIKLYPAIIDIDQDQWKNYYATRPRTFTLIERLNSKIRVGFFDTKQNILTNPEKYFANDEQARIIFHDLG